MNIPNLVGIELEVALSKLQVFKQNYDIIIKKTISSKQNIISENNECRVVRQRILDNTIEITVSYF